MNCQDLTRRELLLTAATGAGMLLGHGAIRRAQAADSTPLIPRKLLFAGADRSTVRISPDGRRIAFMAPVDGVLNLWVGEIDNLSKARPLTRVTDRDLGPWIVWLYNNRHVVFFRDQGGDENWQAHRVDVDTGDILTLTPGPGVKSYIQQTSRHLPDELLIAHNQRDQRFSDIFRVNVATGASTLLLANDRFAWVFTDPRFRARFGVRQTDAGDTEYLQRGAGGDWELFTRIDMADALTTRAIEFSDDGAELYWLDSRGRDKAVLVGEDLRTGAKRILAEDPEADLVEVMLEPRSYRPFATAAVFARKRWQMLDPAYGQDRAWLANRGYAVLSVNFRGSTGFGKSFVNAANLEWGGRMHDDLIDAVDWAIARGIADAKRVAIYGASYGGYSALVGATFTPEKFACAIDLFGISNLVTFVNAIPPYWKPWQALWKARMGDYTTEAGRRFLQERSPLNRADRIVRPLLLGQGANDVRVKPAESDQIVAAMRERGVPVTYVFYSDEGHGFGRVESGVAVQIAVAGQNAGDQHGLGTRHGAAVVGDELRVITSHGSQIQGL